MPAADASTNEPNTQKASHWSGSAKALAIVAALLLLGHLPLLIQHFLSLWARPHYQFVIFLPVIVWLLAKQRLSSADDTSGLSQEADGPRKLHPAHVLVWSPVLLLSLGTLAAATFLPSPWLGMASALITCLGFILAVGGLPLLRCLLPAWFMLAMALPMPGNLDVRLITFLREITTHMSSLVLDQFGILHLVSGNVIELPSQSLFIADACTGVHSLFVLLTCALFVGFWQRRGIVHIVLLVAAAVGVVLVENVARVVGLAMALDYFGIDLTEGWRHTVFGFVLFTVSLVFIFSADQLLAFLWPSGSWISLPRWRRERRHRKTVGLAAAANKRVSNATATLTAVDGAMAHHSRRLLLSIAVGFAALGIVPLVWMPTHAEQMVQLLKRHPLDLPEFGAQAVPSQWNGWTLQDFEMQRRVVDDPMGELSQVWTYQRDGVVAILSLDYPYTQAHDLTSCYRATGWQVDDREILTDAQADSEPFAFVRMNRDLHGNRLLYYSLYDTTGTCDVRFKEDLTLNELLRKRVDNGVPWFQIQVLAAGPIAFTPEHEEQVQTLFLHMRETLKQTCLQALNSGS